MSVVLVARPVLVIATIIWVCWRVVTWFRGRSGDPAREVVIAVLFAWLLVIVRLTFFPLVIIFYDWQGGSNIVPFASIYQLLTDTPAAVAFDNIVGNLVLFVPLGVLLPLLFQRLQNWSRLLWRAAAISVLIEATQFITQARSVDIDDVILNTGGALCGYAAYRALEALAQRSLRGRTLLDRMASTTQTEPLLLATVPFVLTALIAVPAMVNQVVDATLSGSGIEAEAQTDWASASIGAQTNINDHTYLVVSELDQNGPLRLAAFQRVLPGRYTQLGTSDEPAVTGSRYSTNISVFNPTEGEQPILAVWGYNDGLATSLEVAGNGVSRTFDLQANDYFVVGTEFVYEASLDLLNFQLTFTDSTGTDITSQFTATNG